MKNKAFTLIELLAVIVILAIIALIATPAVLNIIEDSRKSAAEASARNIARSAETHYIQTTMKGTTPGIIDLTGNTLNYNGDKPEKGYVYFDDKGNSYIKMYINGYCVISDYDNTTEVIKIKSRECKINSLIIFVDLDGGKLEDITLEYEQGDIYGELPIPTKDGYTFIGWFDKSGNEITPDTVIDKSSTIYAKWEANIYTVTLSLPNETIPETEGWNIVNGVPIKEIAYDTEYGLLPSPYKDGYTFTGWYTSGGFKINSDSILIIPNNHTLTGQYTPNKYLVTYVYNNGNVDTVETVTYDANYNLPEPTKVGYTFLGWYDGNTKIENNSVIKILSDKTYEAKWEANKYTISFNSNGGISVNDIEVTYDSAYGTFPTSTKTGYNFHGWATSSGVPVTETTIVKVTEDTTLYAQWGVNTYLITYDANGGTVTPPNVTLEYNSAYGTLPSPSKTGYTFNGWYTAASGGIEVSASTKVTTAYNHSIYAQWTPITYTVTFDANGGTVSPSSVTLEYDGVYGTLPTPTRTRYIFQGWYTAASGGTQVTSGTKVTVSSNHSIYAQWKRDGYIAYTDGTPLLYDPVHNVACSDAQLELNINNYKAVHIDYENNPTIGGLKDGCMKWYAFLDDNENSSTVNLILDHNTTVEVAWNSDKTKTTPDTVLAQLAADITNWNTTVKSTARLISAEEINQIAPKVEWSPWAQNDYSKWYFFHDGSQTAYQGAAETNNYAWLFDNTWYCTTYGCNATLDNDTWGYWTSSYAVSATAWYVSYRGSMHTYGIESGTNGYGVRPVITVPKSIFE